MNIDIIIKISSFISTLIIILTSINKIINYSLKPLNDKINKIDENQCRNYLVDFLSDIENGNKKSDCQINRAYAVYDHYINDLKENSYIKDKWNKVMEGLK